MSGPFFAAAVKSPIRGNRFESPDALPPFKQNGSQPNHTHRFYGPLDRPAEGLGDGFSGSVNEPPPGVLEQQPKECYEKGIEMRVDRRQEVVLAKREYFE